MYRVLVRDLRSVNMMNTSQSFRGFLIMESIFNNFPLSAAVTVPPASRLIITSGHVGMGPDGRLTQGLEGQISMAFEVRNKEVYFWRAKD